MTCSACYREEFDTLPNPGFINNTLYIGRNYQGTTFFDGTLDEFRIYNYSLTPEQINNNYLLNYNKIISNETTRTETYTCSITPNDREADGETLNSTSLTIENHPPDAVVLLAPTNNSILGKLSNFNWTASGDDDPEDSVSYILQISTDETFTVLNYTTTLTTTNDPNVELERA